MRTARRVLATMLVVGLVAVPAPARALKAPRVAIIDAPPDVADLSYYDAVTKLLGWCEYTTFELAPQPTQPTDLDGATLFVRKMAFTNPDSASCDSGKETPKIQFSLYSTVPDLLRVTKAEAEALLAKRALGMVVLTGPDDAESLVTEQKPAEGTQIDIDTYPVASQTVAVALAAPPSGRIVVVPDLTSWREDDACAALVDRQLTCDVNASGAGPAPGTVVRQDPPPGFEIVVGRTVTLFVDRTVAPTTPSPAPLTPEPEGLTIGPAAYATGAGLLVILLLVLLLLLAKALRRPRMPVTTAARARLEPGGWQIEELPGRPNLAVAVRTRAEPYTSTVDETGGTP